MTEIKKLIDEFIEDELFLEQYTRTDNLSNEDYDAKLTVKIGKRITKNLNEILKTDEGINEFEKLLEHPEPIIRFLAARFLYPLYPKKCLKIMEAYKKGLSNELRRYEAEVVIKSLKKQEKVFVEQFNELYGKQMF